MPDMSWKEAVERVLNENKKPMHYTAIAAEIMERRLKDSKVATPSTSANVALRLSIRNEREESPFVALGNGLYSLKGIDVDNVDRQPEDGDELIQIDENENITGIIKAFGMYWSRERVLWGGTGTSIFGCQRGSLQPINFKDQRGVYVLYDHAGLLYVGLCIDQGLGKRLWDHTKDRLEGRWERFSWFGLKGVTEDGELTEMPERLTIRASLAISTLETILIEVAEPRQNRKRGQQDSALEYLQAEDPERARAVENRQILDTIQRALNAR